MKVAPAWGHSRHKFAGDDFKIIDDSEVRCPAGHPMERQEIRYNAYGDRQMIFGIKAATCRSCPFIQQCHSKHSKNTRGRRVAVTRKRLSAPQDSSEHPMLVVQPRAPLNAIPGCEAILWTDLPATTYRRHLQFALTHNRIEIEPLASQTAGAPPTQPLLTRHQRAHRRWSWKQRLRRNQLRQPQMLQWKVQLFGLSPALTQFLKSPLHKESGAS